MAYSPSSLERDDRYAATPPPIPLRNPRRIYPTLKEYGPFHREIDAAHDRLARARRSSENRGTRLWQNSNIRASEANSARKRSNEVEQSSLVWSDAEAPSRTSTSSSFTDGLKRLSASNHSTTLYGPRREGEEAARQRHIDDAVVKFRRARDSLDASETAESDENPSPTNDSDEEDARVERWLQKGALGPSGAECGSQRSITTTAVAERDRPILSVVPSLRTSVVRRDHATPLSPLNNGRDVYGNLIATNPHDYFTSQSPPTSPPLRPITEDLDESKSVSTPSLRGGGGWWNMGFGQSAKEPFIRKSRKSESGSISVPASVMQSKSSLFVHSAAVDESRVAGRNPFPGGIHAGAKGQSAVATDGEWSEEESDQASLDSDGRRQSNLLFYGGGTHPDDASRRQSTASSTVDDPQAQVISEEQEPSNNMFPYPLRPVVSAAAKEHLNARWASKQPRKVDEGHKTTSEVSYESRLEKRWNRAPSMAPVTRVPPPPPQDVATASSSSYGKSRVKEQYAYEYGRDGASIPRPINPDPYMSLAPQDHIYDEDGWDIQSLELGESVSMVGGPRRNREVPVLVPPVPQISAEEYKARQLEAQAAFRGLCQDIMSRYNSEMSWIQRQIQLGNLLPSRGEVHKNELDRNRIKALRRSAQECGYVVSTHLMSARRGNAGSERMTDFDIDSRGRTHHTRSHEDYQRLPYLLRPPPHHQTR